MAIKIQKAGFDEFLAGGDKYRILLFGAPSAGKTPWAAQAPKPLVLAVDKSAPSSLAMSGTDFVKITGSADMDEALKYLERESGRPSFEFETVVLDTISVLQARVINEMLRASGRGDLADVDGGWTALKSKMNGFLDRLHRLNLNLIVLCHLKDKHGSNEIEPDLTGSLKGDLPKEFPFIGHLLHDWDRPKDAPKGSDSPSEASESTVKREVVRTIHWRATPKFPILRSPGGVLDVTSVTFEPSDWTQVVDGLSKISGAVPEKSSVVAEVVVEEPAAQPAPPDVEGGPVEPKVPAKKAAKKAAPKAGEATEKAPAKKSPAKKAVEAVKEVLGGKEVPLEELIAAASSHEELTELWRENKAVWTAEHTELVKQRKAALPQS